MSYLRQYVPRNLSCRFAHELVECACLFYVRLHAHSLERILVVRKVTTLKTLMLLLSAYLTGISCLSSVHAVNIKHARQGMLGVHLRPTC